ncbi:ABC transporter substrate-binding protein [Paralcaligenes ureilyticus]|uniref:ABC transporter substrate-binding protein n=1 Tax=Paralcaligenes ureilyticus TaxID=627131 RepID=UPI00104F9710
MKRRDILKFAATAPFALTAPAILNSARAAEDNVIIGGIWSMSGFATNIGTPLDSGSRYAIEAYRSIFGRKLEYVLADDRSDPGQAIRQMQELIAKRGVKYFAGSTSSSIALAVGKEAYSRKAVYSTVGGADEITGKDCNRSMFRWPASTYSAIHATMLPLIEVNPKAKRWYTITGQYTFGDSLLNNVKSVLKEKGLEHVGNSYHSLADREFSAMIAGAIAAKPDVLVICNFGTQTVDVVRQAVSFGAKRSMQILVPWSTGLDQYQALGPDVCEGVYFGANYWHTIDAPGNRVLRDLVQKKTGGVPSYMEAAGYGAVQMMLEGMRAAKSSNPELVIPAMEGLKYEGVTGEETIRPGDHQVIKPYILMKGKARAAMKDKYDFAEIVASDKAFAAVEETGCVMPKG